MKRKVMTVQEGDPIRRMLNVFFQNAFEQDATAITLGLAKGYDRESYQILYHIPPEKTDFKDEVTPRDEQGRVVLVVMSLPTFAYDELISRLCHMAKIDEGRLSGEFPVKFEEDNYVFHLTVVEKREYLPYDEIPMPFMDLANKVRAIKIFPTSLTKQMKKFFKDKEKIEFINSFL